MKPRVLTAPRHFAPRRPDFPSAVLVILAILGTACGESAEEGSSIPKTRVGVEEWLNTMDATSKADVSDAVDICEWNGWYGDGECDKHWYCWRIDPDCVVPLGPVPNGLPSRYPILLVHGFNATPGSTLAFYRVWEALNADRHAVYEVELEPYNSVAVRAETLAEWVDTALYQPNPYGYAESKVHIIAHSMGGLDARYLISSLGYADRVASLTTIATPHRGTPVADFLLDVFGWIDELGVSERDLDEMAEVLGHTFFDVKGKGDVDLVAGLQDLSSAAVENFDRENPDQPTVYYQSFAGVSSFEGWDWNKDNEKEACEGRRLKNKKNVSSHDEMDGLLIAASMITSTHGEYNIFDRDPNDGVVTVRSAKWGNFRTCIPADHMDEIGQIKDKAPDLRTGFDHIRFYRNLAYELDSLVHPVNP